MAMTPGQWVILSGRDLLLYAGASYHLRSDARGGHECGCYLMSSSASMLALIG